MVQGVLSTGFALQKFEIGSAEQALVEIHQSAIARVIAVMRSNVAEPLSLSDMADIACLSPYYFNRVFHRAIGLPPCEFLAALRLDAAKRLLLTTDLSVTDICFAVGYNALGSFTSRFTQQTGYSPRHLRLRIQEGAERRLNSAADPLGDVSSVWQSSYLSGCIDAPGLSEGSIYLGMFSKPIPQGKPFAGTMLTAPGPFHLGPLLPGWYYLMIAAFPASRDPRSTLLPDSNCLVGIKGPIVIQERKLHPFVEIRLRPLRLTDPPILTALL